MENEDKTIHKFQSNTEEVLKMIVHNLYKDRDVFIRELICNASDACDKFKLKYNELQATKPSVHCVEDLRIDIYLEKENNRIIIKDKGTGLTKSEIINYIGTVASSGTRKLKELLKETENTGQSSMIGQFGVGFYSSFLVADKVMFVSHSVYDDCFAWESAGSDYSVRKVSESDPDYIDGVGSSVVLYLKEDASKFLDLKTLKTAINKHSRFVFYPVYIHDYVEDTEEDTKTTADQEDPEKVEGNEDAEETGIAKAEPEVQDKEKKMKWSSDLVNDREPVWTKSPEEVTPEEYKNFYQTISKDWGEFLGVKHIVLDGAVSAVFVLFIPKMARNHIFDKDNNKTKNIHLYIQNVFVTDDLMDAIPNWLNFVSGVVAFADAPINISREVAQGSAIYKQIKSYVPNAVLQMINDFNEKDFDDFYREFSSFIKAGIIETSGATRTKWASTLRFITNKNPEKLISLDTYIENNCSGEDKNIYCLNGLVKNDLLKDPILSLYANKEVIIMHESVDEIMLRGFDSYKEHSIKRVTNDVVKSDLEACTEMEPLCIEIKKILEKSAEKVEAVRGDGRSPLFLKTTAYGQSAVMQHLMINQPGASTNKFSQMMGQSKLVVIIDANNNMIKECAKKLGNGENITDSIVLMSYVARIAQGYPVSDVQQPIEIIYKMMESNILKHEVAQGDITENLDENDSKS